MAEMREGLDGLKGLLVRNAIITSSKNCVISLVMVHHLTSLQTLGNWMLAVFLSMSSAPLAARMNMKHSASSDLGGWAAWLHKRPGRGIEAAAAICINSVVGLTLLIDAPY